MNVRCRLAPSGPYKVVAHQKSPAEEHGQAFAVEHRIITTAALCVNVQVRLTGISRVPGAAYGLSGEHFVSALHEHAAASQMCQTDDHSGFFFADHYVISRHILGITIWRREIRQTVHRARNRTVARTNNRGPEYRVVIAVDWVETAGPVTPPLQLNQIEG